jgi:hypothetical protein
MPAITLITVSGDKIGKPSAPIFPTFSPLRRQLLLQEFPFILMKSPSIIIPGAKFPSHLFPDTTPY